MIVNSFTKPIFKLFSKTDIGMKSYYWVNRLSYKIMDVIYRPYYGIEETEIKGVPVRVFKGGKDILIFIHGGGWCVESFISYAKLCNKLRNITGRTVIAIDYRLAPKNPYPAAVNDCYSVVKHIFDNNSSADITLIGDSAGGNLCAVMSIMGRDKKEFSVNKQILIYPVVNNDYSEKSPYPSVHENGSDYLLTVNRLKYYVGCYIQNENDKNNPYFAPILEDNLSDQPKTLVITAEYDPLRDEGIAYAEKLRKFGNEAKSVIIKNTTHGYFVLPKWLPEVKNSFNYIKEFLGVY